MKNILLIATLLFVAAGCGAGSYITSSWTASNIQPQKYKKIMVLGLIGEPDRSLRENMENHLVGDLKALGYDAVCACNEFNPKAFENMNEKEAITKLHDSGIDAVITIVLLDKTKEKYYVPGRVYYTPFVIYHDRFYNYYRTMYERVYREGYYVTDTRYFWESNLYDLKDNTLLYSAQSQSFDPASSETLGHEYGKMIVKNLVAKNILHDQATLKAY